MAIAQQESATGDSSTKVWDFTVRQLRQMALKAALGEARHADWLADAAFAQVLRHEGDGELPYADEIDSLDDDPKKRAENLQAAWAGVEANEARAFDAGLSALEIFHGTAGLDTILHFAGIAIRQADQQAYVEAAVNAGQH